jgi:DNA-binding Lrp family transcriptional regulator
MLPTIEACRRAIFVRLFEIFLPELGGLVQKRQSCQRRCFVFRADLDAIDIKILRELQNDGRMTNVELATRVGISAPPCLRRVRRLEESGVIEGYRTLLNGPMLGFDLVAFSMVGLKHQSEANLKSFAVSTSSWPLVRQAWMVSGDSDFLLHCVAENLTQFQDFVIEVLTANEHVDTVRTMLTIRQVKKLGLVEV